MDAQYPRADAEDHWQKTHHGVESHNLQKLEQAIRSCGVCFRIWQNKEPTGKPIAGSFDWTPLSGKRKLQVLKNLPAKMDRILKENIAPSVTKLWNVSDYCTAFGVTCNTIMVDALTSCLLHLPLHLSTDTT